MATHSSILAWEIPWTEKPGGLRSIGLQGVSEILCAEDFCTQQVLDRTQLLVWWLSWWLCQSSHGNIIRNKASSREGSGHQLQYSCLGNPMDRGAWWTTVHGVTKSWP